MSEIPGELSYSKSHEWVRSNEDGSITVGITDYAQDNMKDIVYVEVPELGTEFGAGDDCAVIDSAKAAFDIYAPVAGEVIEVNESLEGAPETVNNDPFGDGWLFRMKPSEKNAVNALMDARGYEEFLNSEE